MNFFLATESLIKISATKKFIENTILKGYNKEYSIYYINCDSLGLPPQPTDEGTYGCALARLNYMKKVTSEGNRNGLNYYISIESGLNTKEAKDICVAFIEHNGLRAYGHDTDSDIKFPEKYLEKFSGEEFKMPGSKIYGYSVTLGDKLHSENPKVSSKNWMMELLGIDRKFQLENTLNATFKNLNNLQDSQRLIGSQYVTYLDFPKPGVMFQDVFPILKNPEAFHALLNIITTRYRYEHITHIVGLESKGFLMGPTLSYLLKIPFVPVRKTGKLPGKCVKFSYTTEYSNDVFEMQADLPKDSYVLIVDDSIATGGSIAAAIELLKLLECNVVDCCVIKQIPEVKVCKSLQGKFTVLVD